MSRPSNTSPGVSFGTTMVKTPVCPVKESLNQVITVSSYKQNHVKFSETHSTPSFYIESSTKSQNAVCYKKHYKI